MSELTTCLSLFLFTFILEDAAILTGSVLVNTKTAGFNLIFISLLLGISMGDIALYFCGRIRWMRIKAYSLIKKKNYKKIKASLYKNSILALITARFVPGFRLPCFFLSGLVGVSFSQFFLTVIITTAIWVYTLLYLFVFLAEIAKDVQTGIQISVAVIVVIIWLYYRYIKKPQNQASKNQASKN